MIKKIIIMFIVLIIFSLFTYKINEKKHVNIINQYPIVLDINNNNDIPIKMLGPPDKETSKMYIWKNKDVYNEIILMKNGEIYSIIRTKLNDDLIPIVLSLDNNLAYSNGELRAKSNSIEKNAALLLLALSIHEYPNSAKFYYENRDKYIANSFKNYDDMRLRLKNVLNK